MSVFGRSSNNVKYHQAVQYERKYHRIKREIKRLIIVSLGGTSSNIPLH